MQASYVDTSALLKLYIFEHGSRWMRREVLPSGITICWLTITEVGSALNQRVRLNSLSSAQAVAAWRRFRRDVRSFQQVEVNRRGMILAAGLAARQSVPLRTLDAIQLQGAIDARAATWTSGQPDPLFITADARLEAAAQALGFATDNPLDHP